MKKFALASIFVTIYAVSLFADWTTPQKCTQIYIWEAQGPAIVVVTIEGKQYAFLMDNPNASHWLDLFNQAVTTGKTVQVYNRYFSGIGHEKISWICKNYSSYERLLIRGVALNSN